MKKKWMLPVILAMLTGAPLGAAWAQETPPTSKRAATSAWTAEGLQKTEVKGFALAYAKPGASLAGYDKVLLRPIPVSFSRGWEKKPAPGSQLRISPKDIQGIKDKLAGAIRDEFTQQLGEGGYALVDTVGEGVLEVDLAIVNLNVIAPNVSSVGRNKAYAVSAGEMTLVATLRDAATGNLLMRFYDHNMARESLKPEQITTIDNAEAVHEAASGWATALRQALDRARGIAKP
jgi:hypothetical protein